MRKILILLLLALVAFATTGAYHLTQQDKIAYFQGHDLFVKGEYRATIPFYLKSLSHDPRRTQSLSELAYAYLWSGNPEKAIAVFQKLLARDAGSERSQKSLADAYAWNKEYAKAEGIYLELLARNPNDRITQKALAEVYLWNQRLAEAKALLADLLRTDPRDARAKFLYGKALLYSGDNQAAIRIFEELKGTPVTKDPSL